ncbi:hypothetical protein Pla123a_47370 [Posidoniimonas polymericola]|uniref:Uncharacterized protein n=1 Tax=Posidoniimonas polymericola TaxID=2528002 RepID=A0A5C5XVB2_9BACT|nr:hypothetical protein [Posidoniimonas polymericola]TWT66343.1 hypothetical protein Pla123a_47370 [Posidoniimonas polymericola]
MARSNAQGRVFASHYQLVICDDPSGSFDEGHNWGDTGSKAGFAGSPRFRMVGTEADLNDHWVELVLSERSPDASKWERVTCCSFHSDTGYAYVKSIVDSEAMLSIDCGQGDFALYVAANNLGVDQLSLGEESNLSDSELAARHDLERYRIFVVPGEPEWEGRREN